MFFRQSVWCFRTRVENIESSQEWIDKILLWKYWNQEDIAKPFTPDTIVYCKSNYIFWIWRNFEEILVEATKSIPTFTEKFGYASKVLLIRGIGLVAVGDNAKQCDIILDVFEDAMKVAYLSKSFGGAHPMTQEQIDFIDN